MKRFALAVCFALAMFVATIATAQTAATAPPAPTCLPAPTIPPLGIAAGPANAGISRAGAWVWWDCLDLSTGATSRYEYVTTVTAVSTLGSRLQTILKAADPLKSVQTLPQRITMLPLTDPTLAAVLADMRATQRPPE